MNMLKNAGAEIQLLGLWYSKLQNISNNLNTISQRYELSFEQFLVLEQVIEENRNSPSELATFFKTSLPAVSRKLNILQAKKLIRKVRGEQLDQRLMWINVTPEGTELYSNIKKTLILSGERLHEKDIRLMQDMDLLLNRINNESLD